MIGRMCSASAAIRARDSWLSENSGSAAIRISTWSEVGGKRLGADLVLPVKQVAPGLHLLDGAFVFAGLPQHLVAHHRLALLAARVADQSPAIGCFDPHVAAMAGHDQARFEQVLIKGAYSRAWTVGLRSQRASTRAAHCEVGPRYALHVMGVEAHAAAAVRAPAARGDGPAAPRCRQSAFTNAMVSQISSRTGRSFRWRHPRRHREASSHSGLARPAMILCSGQRSSDGSRAGCCCQFQAVAMTGEAAGIRASRSGSRWVRIVKLHVHRIGRESGRIVLVELEQRRSTASAPLVCATA